MIHISRFHVRARDARGRALPPSVRCWASCDECHQEGEPVFGDDEWDKLSAFYQADLAFVQVAGKTRALCHRCRAGSMTRQRASTRVNNGDHA